MIISEKHLRKVIREIIIESDEGVRVPTSYEDVRDEVEAERNRPKLPDQVTTDEDDTGSYDTGSYNIYLPDEQNTGEDVIDSYQSLLSNKSNARNQLTSLSIGSAGYGLQSLIDTDRSE